MKLYAHLSIDADREKVNVSNRDDLDTTVIDIGPDIAGHIFNDIGIYVRGTSTERVTFLRNLAGALLEMANAIDEEQTPADAAVTA